MELTLNRKYLTANSTIGELAIDGIFECYVLEDTVRPNAEGAGKIKGKTAIPAGRYRIDITMSARFHKELPLLLDVPNYAGIRIHPGNRPTHTEGCLLPGRTRAVDLVGESKIAFDHLFIRLRDAKQRQDEIWITITNPESEAA